MASEPCISAPVLYLLLDITFAELRLPGLEAQIFISAQDHKPAMFH